jgi:hypothetical protein
MKKYKNNPIVLIDDDTEYAKDMLATLIDGYIKYPNAVSARIVHKIKTNLFGKVKPYTEWNSRYVGKQECSKRFFANNVGGVLYPPDIINIRSVNVEEIKDCLYADDVYLKYLETKYNIKTTYTPYFVQDRLIQDFVIRDTALCNINVEEGRNDMYINKFNIL